MGREGTDYLRGSEPRFVTYVDPVGKPHNALLTAIWNVDEENEPVMVNLVFVVDDKTRNDHCGRQIERATSVPRQSDITAHGRYFTL